MSPTSAEASHAYFLATMLRAAAMRQVPTRSAQKMCPGIQAGTIPARILVAVKCSAPNTARGTAKQIGPRATILSNLGLAKFLPEGDQADGQDHSPCEKRATIRPRGMRPRKSIVQDWLVKKTGHNDQGERARDEWRDQRALLARPITFDENPSRGNSHSTRFCAGHL